MTNERHDLHPTYTRDTRGIDTLDVDLVHELWQWGQAAFRYLTEAERSAIDDVVSVLRSFEEPGRRWPE